MRAPLSFLDQRFLAKACPIQAEASPDDKF
jgi:hypothetical protein